MYFLDSNKKKSGRLMSDEHGQIPESIGFISEVTGVR